MGGNKKRRAFDMLLGLAGMCVALVLLHHMSVLPATPGLEQESLRWLWTAMSFVVAATAGITLIFLAQQKLRIGAELVRFGARRTSCSPTCAPTNSWK